MNMNPSIQVARENFAKLLDDRMLDQTGHRSLTVSGLARGIRAIVKSGKTTWEELGFTVDDLNERVRRAI